MNKKYLNKTFDACTPYDISDDDVISAMKEIKGYLDITTGDFKALYRIAYAHAVERISRLFNASDVMTENVFFVKIDTPAEEVAQLMAAKGVSGVPVVDGNERVIGVISEKDFLSQMASKDLKSFMDVIAHCLKNKGCLALPVRKQTAEAIMTSPAVVVSPDTTITEIGAIMTEKGINRVPVTNNEGKLVGIVSRADIIRTSCAIPPVSTDRK